MSKSYREITRSISASTRKLRTAMPETMAGWTALAQSALKGGALDPKTKELICLALGVASHCDGCIGYHVAALVKLGDNFIQISQDNAFGQGSAAGFYKVVKNAGGKFPINDDEKGVGTIFAPPDTTDFTPYINQILDSKADVLIVTWSGAGFVPMFQQMTQMGVFKQMDVATGMGDNQTLAKGYADAVNSVGVSVYHYSLFDTPENKYLTDEHIKRFDVPPDLWAEAGFNCAVMVKQALEATKGDTDGDKLIAALEGMKFEGPKGNYEVRASDHALLQPMTLVKLTNTTDPDFRFFDLVTLFKPEETAPPCAVPAEQGRCK